MYYNVANRNMNKHGYFIPILLTSLLLCCTLPLQSEQMTEISIHESTETSGRNSIHEGDWAVAQKQRMHCESTFDYDIHSDYIATLDCPSYGESYITIYHNSDWNVLIESVESDISIDLLEFSPDGSYLVAYGNLDFEIYRTSDWEQVFSGNVLSENGYYYDINGITWSGDGERILFMTGEDGGKMYEGPDWEEVTGTSSTGIYAVHHPTKDILWYVNNDATGNEYEFENIPFVGYQWVMKRSFTLTYNPGVGPLSVDPDGDYLVMSTEYGVSAYSTSDYSLEFTSSTASGPVSFSTNSDSIMFQNEENYDIYSTSNWQEISSITGPEHDCYYDGAIKFRFTSGDGELLVLDNLCYETYLSGWMPDEDSDGTADVQDICPFTPETEESDAKGCSLSQKDTDLDGVNDRDDICPRTKINEIANGSGCSPSQLQDTDGDGSSDSDDLCPDTPADEPGNIYGCSSSQRDVDGDGLSDSTDNCPLSAVDACPNIISWEVNKDIIPGTSEFSTPKWSPSGEFIMTRYSDSENIFLLDSNFSLETEVMHSVPDTYIRDYLWTPNGQSIILFWESSNYYNSTCGYSIIDVSGSDEAVHNPFSLECDYTKAYAINPDGSEVAISYFYYETYTAKMISIKLESGVEKFVDENYYPDSLTYTHDGTALIGTMSGSILIWDTFDGYLIRSKSVGSFDFLLLSPEGDFVYTWKDDIIKIHSFNSLELLFYTSVERNSQEVPYEARIAGLEFSRNNKLLYVSMSERTYGQTNYYNTSIHTYEIVNSHSSINYIGKTADVNQSYWINSDVSPDESKAIVRLGGGLNGYIVWKSDSDGDKMGDLSDQCPNTGMNDSIDENGCSWEQQDDDSDEVSNMFDLCPNTPEGILTDEVGCTDQQVDQDLDGVCNEGAMSTGPSNCAGEDDCPNTPPGKPISSIGCSWEQEDEDLDYVQNGNDLCPDTDIFDTANSVGCGEKQRDTDGDTVNDFWDVCSSTGVNLTVDEVGCSDIEVDSDSDTVCDRDAPSSGPSDCKGTDTCPNTGANESVDSNGCSWNQKDDDSDGIFNGNDACPGTTKPDGSPDGCSSWQRDSDDDGIADAIDECAKTPADEFSNQVGCSDSQGQGSMSSDEDDSSIAQWAIIAGIVVIALLFGGFLLRRDGLAGEDKNAPLIYPEYATRGVMKEGREWIEYPEGSGNSFYRDPSTGQWVKND